MIRDIEVHGRRIWGRVIYNISYDIGQKKYICECPMFCFKGWCKHLSEFEKIVKDLYAKGNDVSEYQDKDDSI